VKVDVKGFPLVPVLVGFSVGFSIAMVISIVLDSRRAGSASDVAVPCAGCAEREKVSELVAQLEGARSYRTALPSVEDPLEQMARLEAEIDAEQ
jgi:hypothetical protein